MCTFEVSIGMFPSFWLSHEKNPCYEKSHENPCQHGAEIFNKLCTFEATIGDC